MKTRISEDPRLQAFGLLLVPAFVAHAIQMLGEDRPWEPYAASRYWYQPGWHLYLEPWVPVALGVALVLGVLGLAVRRRRRWLAAIIALYWAHYLTFPFRIRNHMSHMFFGLTMLGAVWIAGRIQGDWRSRAVDRTAVTGLALVLCTTYFFAGFHKTNTVFLSVSDASTAASSITQFWIYADLGSVPPVWVKWLAAYGTVFIECAVPWVAWRSERLRVWALLTLMLFHYPMVSSLNVSDYPMIVSVSYPCLFSEAHFRAVIAHAGVSRWTVTGAVVGAAMQVWAIPWWGDLTIFGIFVLGLWGWAAGAMLRETLRPSMRETMAPASA
ncbi:MAG: hypothetical protein AB8I08_25850 [Sandaracinaceae bacterium]